MTYLTAALEHAGRANKMEKENEELKKQTEELEKENKALLLVLDEIGINHQGALHYHSLETKELKKQIKKLEKQNSNLLLELNHVKANLENASFNHLEINDFKGRIKELEDALRPFLDAIQCGDSISNEVIDRIIEVMENEMG